MLEFENRGGAKRLKEVSKEDLKLGTHAFKELLTYDLPKVFKRLYNDLKQRRF